MWWSTRIIGSPGQLFYFGWEGGQGDLLEAPGAVPGNADPLPFDNSGSRIALASQGIEFEQEGQIDVVDLAAGEVRGYRVRCLTGEYIPDPLLGPDFLTYQCVRDGERTGYFRFVPLEAPESGRLLARCPPSFPIYGRRRFRWLTNSRIAMTNVASSGREQTACVADLHDWQPMCRRLPYVSGGVSPDGEKVEVREGPWGDPDRVGVIPVSCLWENRSATSAVQSGWRLTSKGSRKSAIRASGPPTARLCTCSTGSTATPKEYRKYTSDVWRLMWKQESSLGWGEFPIGQIVTIRTSRGSRSACHCLAFGPPTQAKSWLLRTRARVCSGGSPWHAFSVETGGFRTTHG